MIVFDALTLNFNYRSPRICWDGTVPTISLDYANFVIGGLVLIV